MLPELNAFKVLFYAESVGVVTSGHVTKKAVTPFDPQLPKTPCYTQTLIHDFITVCTVVQNCCKGDERCQWNTPIFRPSVIENPEPIDIKFGRGDYVGDITPHANFGISTPKGGGCTYA